MSKEMRLEWAGNHCVHLMLRITFSGSVVRPIVDNKTQQVSHSVGRLKNSKRVPHASKQNERQFFSFYKHVVLFVPYKFVDQHCFTVHKTVVIVAVNIPSQPSQNKMKRAHDKKTFKEHTQHTLNLILKIYQYQSYLEFEMKLKSISYSSLSCDR